MLLAGIQGALGAGAGRVDLGNLCASRDTVSVLRIQPPKGDVVGRIHHHRDDVLLADPHQCLKTIILLGEDFRLQHLRGKVLRIGVEILHQPLKIRSCGSGDKRSTAPVVQHGSGHVCARGRCELLDDQLSPAQACLAFSAFRRRSYGSEEGSLGPMLLSKARLNRSDIRVEC